MSTYTKYLPHLSLTAFIIFLATDYFPLVRKTVSFIPEKSMSIKEGGNQKTKFKKNYNIKGESLLQEGRERRMAIFHYNEGNKFYNKQNYSEAVIHYKKALHHHKNFKEALINLSTAYMKINLLDKALKTLQTGQSRFPQEALFDYNYACYHSLKKNLTLGLSALKQATEKGFKEIKKIENDSDLNNLRQSDEYKKWIKKISSERVA